jgi:integrase
MSTLLGSALGSTISQYLALKQALGRRYAVERKVLRHLDAFLAPLGSDLRPETFARWCHSQEHLSSGVRRKRMQIVRNLCLYRRRGEPACFVPDSSQFPPSHQTLSPYIFTEAEVAKLLHAAGSLVPTTRTPLRPQVFRLAIVLLYTTGMRRGEFLRLSVGDYDPGECTLLVRESKFHKSRLLPLSQDGVQEINSYLEARRAHQGSVAAEAPLLWNRHKGGSGYSGSGFSNVIRALFRAAEIHTAAGALPRVHDFRHTLAVHALLRWYRSGVDVQTKLPFLAAYMGHVSIASTEYYLHFVDELAAAASDRFARHCGALVKPAATTGDAR